MMTNREDVAPSMDVAPDAIARRLWKAILPTVNTNPEIRRIGERGDGRLCYSSGLAQISESTVNTWRQLVVMRMPITLYQSERGLEL